MTKNLSSAIAHLEVSESLLCKELEAKLLLKPTKTDDMIRLTWAICEVNVVIVELKEKS